MSEMSQPAFDFGAEEALADEPLDDATNPTLTVSELADGINRALRRTFSDGVWVRGEIQELRDHNGHLYLTLADDTPGQKAVLRVQFFAPARARLRPLLTQHRLRLAVGMKVRIFGRLDFFAPSGSLGLKMTDLDPRFTLGDLAQQREHVLRRLAADGSLDRNGRLALSPAPLRIGVVSSAGTAAWHDFHDELVRSGLAFRLVLADTRVQGPMAARSVASSIATLGRYHERHGLDAIAIIRGGGARNELAVFDAEPIARAIAAAAVPVLTGLGHEVDRAVADECAHTAFKTPTACAASLVAAVHRYVDATEQAFAAIRATAADRLLAADQRLGERAHRIARRTHDAVERADERMGVRLERLTGRAAVPLDAAARHLDRVAERLAVRAPVALASQQRRLDEVEARIRLLDPVNLLARGWSITRGPDGRIVRSIAALAAGDVITSQFADGTATSRVESPPPADPPTPTIPEPAP